MVRLYEDKIIDCIYYGMNIWDSKFITIGKYLGKL